jgi:hypothetical protein
VQKVAKVAGDVLDVQKNFKNSRLELENVRAEAKLFKRIFLDVSGIAEDIAECCDKIMKLDKVLSDQVVRQCKDLVVQHELSQARALADEELKMK